MKEKDYRPGQDQAEETRPNRPLSTAEILASLTDADVKEMGYSSLEVFKMAHELSNLAAEWRRTKDNVLVQDYHEQFYRLIDAGWDPNSLDLEDALPMHLMPDLPEDFQS